MPVFHASTCETCSLSRKHSPNPATNRSLFSPVEYRDCEEEPMHGSLKMDHKLYADFAASVTVQTLAESEGSHPDTQTRSRDRHLSRRVSGELRGAPRRWLMDVM